MTLTYDEWKTDDPDAEFLGDAHQEDFEEAATTRDEDMDAGVSLRPEDFVFFFVGARGVVVRLGEVMLLESEGNYTRMILGSGRAFVLRRPIYQCEKRLDPKVFYRVNRECIVNLAHVKEVGMLDPKRYFFLFSDGRKVEVSRKRSVSFRREMGF